MERGRKLSTQTPDANSYEIEGYDEKEIVSIRIDEDDLQTVDRMIEDGIFDTRTEAICYSLEHHLSPRSAETDYEMLEEKGYEAMNRLEEKGMEDTEMYFHLGKHLGMIEVLSQLD